MANITKKAFEKRDGQDWVESNQVELTNSGLLNIVAYYEEQGNNGSGHAITTLDDLEAHNVYMDDEDRERYRELIGDRYAIIECNGDEVALLSELEYHHGVERFSDDVYSFEAR